MKVTRLYTGADGESHFEDMDMPLKEDLVANRRSASMNATGVIFRETSGEYDLTWHNASRRQYLIMVYGVLEMVLGDGTTRQFRPGDIVLAEDVTGRGHVSRDVDGQPRGSIFVTLD